MEATKSLCFYETCKFALSGVDGKLLINNRCQRAACNLETGWFAVESEACKTAA